MTAARREGRKRRASRRHFRLHPEDSELGVLDGRVERGAEGHAEHAPRVHRVDHAVVPEARRAEVGAALGLEPGGKRREEERGLD